MTNKASHCVFVYWVCFHSCICRLDTDKKTLSVVWICLTTNISFHNISAVLRKRNPACWFILCADCNDNISEQVRVIGGPFHFFFFLRSHGSYLFSKRSNAIHVSRKQKPSSARWPNVVARAAEHRCASIQSFPGFILQDTQLRWDEPNNGLVEALFDDTSVQAICWTPGEIQSEFLSQHPNNARQIGFDLHFQRFLFQSSSCRILNLGMSFCFYTDMRSFFSIWYPL